MRLSGVILFLAVQVLLAKSDNKYKDDPLSVTVTTTHTYSVSQFGWSNSNVGSAFGYYGSRGTSIFGNSHTNYNFTTTPFIGYSASNGLIPGGSPGFIGGSIAGIFAVEVYHQYKQYQHLMSCYPNNCGHGKLFGLKDEACVEGCPSEAYCDYGICRCREGFEPRFGQCWKSSDEFDARQRDWDFRVNSTQYTPYIQCSKERDCHREDMNLVCKTGACACRDNMKWNDQVKECQIFIDVDCSDKVNVDEIKNATLTKSKQDEENKKKDPKTVTVVEGPFDKKVNVSTITAEDSLKHSELNLIDLSKANQGQITQSFCLGFAKTVFRYTPPESEGIPMAAKLMMIVICILLVCCCCFCCIKNYIRDKIKQRHEAKVAKFQRAVPLAVMENVIQNNEHVQQPMMNVPPPPGPGSVYMQPHQAQQAVYYPTAANPGAYPAQGGGYYPMQNMGQPMAYPPPGPGGMMIVQPQQDGPPHMTPLEAMGTLYIADKILN